MKLTTALILSFAFASSMGAAHAEDITPDNTATQVWTHTKTRAEVRAEVLAARADGTLMAAASEGGSAYAATTLVPSSRIATALRRELRASAGNDLAHAVVGEDSGSFWLSRSTAGITASPVMTALQGASR